MLREQIYRDREKPQIEQRNLNFIGKQVDLFYFLEKFKNQTTQYTKELQKNLISGYSEAYLGEGKKREKYYNRAIRKEKIYENEYTFDARIILITSSQLQEILDMEIRKEGGDFRTHSTNIIGPIISGGLSSGFGLIHMKNRTNIGLINIPDEAINAIPPEKKDDIIKRFQKRASEGNHDRFHNKSMDTIDKVLVKERIYSIKEMISFLPEKYPIILRWIAQYPRFREFYNYIYKKYLTDDIISFLIITERNGIKQTHKNKKKNNDDYYVKLRKFYNNYIRDSKRKKIDVPQIMGGGRRKSYGPFFIGAPETHMYEYLSILIHFRFFSIVYVNHPDVEKKIIIDTEEYLALIQGLDIDQKYKDFWTGIYLRFTARSIDLRKLNIEKLIDYIPKISDSNGELDIYAFNDALKEDVKRMDQGYTVT